MTELTEKQYEIFKKVKATWEKRVGVDNVDDEALKTLKRIIILADTDNDGLKRVSLIGSDKVHPIEDIILYGLRSSDLDEYPTEDKNASRRPYLR